MIQIQFWLHSLLPNTLLLQYVFDPFGLARIPLNHFWFSSFCCLSLATYRINIWNSEAWDLQSIKWRDSVSVSISKEHRLCVPGTNAAIMLFHRDTFLVVQLGQRPDTRLMVRRLQYVIHHCESIIVANLVLFQVCILRHCCFLKIILKKLSPPSFHFLCPLDQPYSDALAGCPDPGLGGRTWHPLFACQSFHNFGSHIRLLYLGLIVQSPGLSFKSGCIGILSA